MRNVGIVLIGAGLLCFLGATGGLGVTPRFVPANQPGAVVQVGGKDQPTREWSKLELLGREVYRREGCASCHTQNVRPFDGEVTRFGPASQAGEWASDPLPMAGTRRVGPDLARVGGKYDDAWHLAHLFDPRLVVPDSTMPATPWLFEVLSLPVEEFGGQKRFAGPPEEAGRIFDLKAEATVEVAADPFGRVFLRDADGALVQKIAAKPVLKLPGTIQEFKPTVVTVIAVTENALALVAYLQRLGTDLGDWREEFLDLRGGSSSAASPAAVAQGERVYQRRCAACHGATGDGRGPATAFLRQPPRPLAPVNEAGEPMPPAFKFTSTHAGALPTDGDLYRTVTRGLRGTAMSDLRHVPERDRQAVVHYMKSLSPWFVEYQMRTGKEWKGTPQPPAEPLSADPYAGKPEEIVKAIATGEELYHGAGACWTCHKSHLPKERVAELQQKLEQPAEWREGADQGTCGKPDAGGRVLAATDFGRDVIKSGADVENLTRLIGQGIEGTGMAPWKGRIPEEQLWALAYYVRSLRQPKEAK